MIRRIFYITLWTVVGVLFILITLLHVPAIQGYIGSEVAETLSRKLSTKVTIGRINVGLLNRIIIDDVTINDQKGQQLFSSSRLSAKFDILPLLHQNISISSSQIFGMKLNVYKETSNSAPNYQFILDSLSSKKTDKPSNLNLKINSLIFRRGEIKYHQLDKKALAHNFSQYNVNIKNFSGHVIVNLLTKDSISLKTKKLSFDETAGLQLKSLSFNLRAGKRGFFVEKLSLLLPNTNLLIDKLSVNYKQPQSLFSFKDAYIDGRLKSDCITLSDFSCFQPILKDKNESFSLDAKVSGDLSKIEINKLAVNAHNNMFLLLAEGDIAKNKNRNSWNVVVEQMQIDEKGMAFVAQLINKEDLIKPILRLQRASFAGSLSSFGDAIKAKGKLHTAIGDAELAFGKDGERMRCRVSTTDFDIQKLTLDNRFGLISADLEIESDRLSVFTGKTKVSRFDFNNYTYRDLSASGIYTKSGEIEGVIQLIDPNANISMSGKANLNGDNTALKGGATVRDLDLAALQLSDKWNGTKFNADINVDLKGLNSSFATGNIDLQNFVMQMPEKEYQIDNIAVNAAPEYGNNQRITLNSDFGDILIVGRGDLKTLPKSIMRMVVGKFYSFANNGNSRVKPNNFYSINATINDTEWMNHLLNIPLRIERPLQINGEIDDNHNNINLLCNLDRFYYDDKLYKDASVEIATFNDTISSTAQVKKISDKGTEFAWRVNANVKDNRLGTTISLNDGESRPIRGEIKTNTRFISNQDGAYSAIINVEESDIHIGDTVWHIRPSDIVYSQQNLNVGNFSLSHGDQYLRINGRATSDKTDTLHVDFKDVNVGYILDMVNFHSVEFDGQASGNAFVAGLFNKRPLARAQLRVDDFLFEGGRMGVLNASVRYDDISGRININGTADDKGIGFTDIKGYVSPKYNHINLDIDAHNTRLEFMESFCSSFMRDVKANANGAVRLSGALNDINLTGQLVVDGSLGISSLNTTYTLRNDTIRFIPDEIEFRRDTIYDRDGNIGIVNGNLHHEHLTNLSYDIDVSAQRMLCFDTTPAQGSSFYGTVYASGNCSIKGRKGEVIMDIDATPNKSTVITYNIDAQDADNANEFLIWKKREDKGMDSAMKGELNAVQQRGDSNDDTVDLRSISTDIKLNFLINCTPDATLKVIMDNASGDYISLNGNGTLRSTYYNKGSFDIFGNYVVDHGLYKLTIQNIVRKDFSFENGGIIKFGGDPFNANLDLKALYILNSVSLSDLNIGRSFSNNNVRVNCLMNINGTAKEPRVTFDLDMPTLENDARQMVASVINAEEEMNQQVLYLLAVGRFYTQGNNNSLPYGSTTQRNQASLAMQSILSGTISQQINSILGTMMNNNNWNFGANISTGTEGFNDAEYEGILSGSLLNNRLLLNGQFGYRDNANATTSFIGDFDLKYLLFPNGNLAINVYNKTNDRYFTRNSLNTQGIGLIMKKDFNGLKELFGKSRNKTKK